MAARKKTTTAAKGKTTKVKKTTSVAERPQEISVATRKKASRKGVMKLIALLLVAGLLYLGRGLFVVALVDGYPITRLSVIRDLEKQGGKQVLDGLVTKRLIQSEAQKKGVSVSEDEITAEVDRITKLAEAQGLTLENALSYQGQTMDQLLENIRLQKMIEKILSDKVSVSEEEMKKYFEDNKDQFTDKKYEDVKGDIEAQLKNQKLSTEYQTWITDLKTNSKVQYVVNY